MPSRKSAAARECELDSSGDELPPHLRRNRRSNVSNGTNSNDDDEKELRLWTVVVTMFLCHRRLLYFLLGVAAGTALSIGLGIGPHWIWAGTQHSAGSSLVGNPGGGRGGGSSRRGPPGSLAGRDLLPHAMRTGTAAGAAAQAAAAAALSGQWADSQCPIPGGAESYKPPSSMHGNYNNGRHGPADVRVAFASHPRSGSTWSRILIERLSGLPTAIERESWANVLVHRQQEHGKLLENGIVIKTHSVCDGCYAQTLEGDGFGLTFNSDLCLNPSPGSFADRVTCGPPEESRRARRQSRGRPPLPCCGSGAQLPYHRAIVLVRHPLDVVKSNFHFRLTSLGMEAVFDYDFVTDRTEAWVQLYGSWLFKDFLPTVGEDNVLLIYYERLREDTPRELRRIRKFLNLNDEIDDDHVLCAAAESSTEVLHAMTDAQLLIPEQISKQTQHFNEAFFGGRAATTSKMTLEYTEEMWQFFVAGSRVQEMAEKLGYNLADVTAMPTPILQNYLD